MLSIRTRCKRLLGKERKCVISSHTLIHPPSQCGCCVQQSPHASKCKWLLLQMDDHATIWQPLLKQDILLQWKWKCCYKLLQTCVEVTNDIDFNAINPEVQSNHANKYVDVKHERNLLDYHPLMDVVNQCEVTHLWWQWPLKYLSTSCKRWMKEMMLRNLKDLKIKGH